MESHSIDTVGFLKAEDWIHFLSTKITIQAKSQHWMLGWFGERLKCSRAALTENPPRTSLLLAFLHAKPKILIPSCCLLSCLPERDLPELQA